MKNVLKTRILAVAIAATFMTAFSSAALANEEKKAIPVELKFVGNVKSQPVFQLTFNNPQESEYTIIVRDDANNVLYRDNVKGTNITKKFLLNTEELGDINFQFEIHGKKTEKTVIYEVNKKSQVIEDVIIIKTN